MLLIEITRVVGAEVANPNDSFFWKCIVGVIGSRTWSLDVLCMFYSVALMGENRKLKRHR